MGKAQASNEFVIVLGVAILLMMVFLGTIAGDMKFLVIKKEMNVIRDIGFSVQNELFLAANVKDGYLREFFIPKKHNGVMLNATIAYDHLIMHAEKTVQTQEFQIPKVQGQLKSGWNNITKQRGVIYLN